MSSESDNGGSGQVKVDDLPFYSPLPGNNYALPKQESGLLQGSVKMVREGMMEGVTIMRQAVSAVTDVVDTGVAHSNSAYYQLTEEDNLPARVGVITGAGLLGLAVGVARGRLLKRVVYSMMGAGGGAALCYPEQAREGGNMVYQEGKNNIMQAYNIITGVSSPPSLTGISNNTDMSLIASTISRTVKRVLIPAIKHVYELGQQQVVIITDKIYAATATENDEEAVVKSVEVPEIVIATNVVVEDKS